MSDHPQQHIKYFWEDLPVGTTLDIGSTTVNRDEVIAFASKYDPQPFHPDEAAMRSPCSAASVPAAGTPARWRWG